MPMWTCDKPQLAWQIEGSTPRNAPFVLSNAPGRQLVPYLLHGRGGRPFGRSIGLTYTASRNR